eukprot:Blabericola_migrator_1__11778@NODE_713_length_6760_cov_48_022561_g433_i1_p1_GENE_NODE_713_length_6760_cov_48_022561_g433_i1NODE_713_length_6760_cov_48_022561_g433_i1_p1_ORF_typecomplete_len1051_score94_91_NODE_713_length_6760_cov_48_022561_g433_i135496701
MVKSNSSASTEKKVKISSNIAKFFASTPSKLVKVVQLLQSSELSRGSVKKLVGDLTLTLKDDGSSGRDKSASLPQDESTVDPPVSGVAQAVKTAHDTGVSLKLSNPCGELARSVGSYIASATQPAAPMEDQAALQSSGPIKSSETPQTPDPSTLNNLLPASGEAGTSIETASHNFIPPTPPNSISSDRTPPHPQPHEVDSSSISSASGQPTPSVTYGRELESTECTSSLCSNAAKPCDSRLLTLQPVFDTPSEELVVERESETLGRNLLQSSLHPVDSTLRDDALSSTVPTSISGSSRDERTYPGSGLDLRSGGLWDIYTLAPTSVAADANQECTCGSFLCVLHGRHAPSRHAPKKFSNAGIRPSHSDLVLLSKKDVKVPNYLKDYPEEIQIVWYRVSTKMITPLERLKHVRCLLWQQLSLPEDYSMKKAIIELTRRHNTGQPPQLPPNYSKTWAMPELLRTYNAKQNLFEPREFLGTVPKEDYAFDASCLFSKHTTEVSEHASVESAPPVTPSSRQNSLLPAARLPSLRSSDDCCHGTRCLGAPQPNLYPPGGSKQSEICSGSAEQSLEAGQVNGRFKTTTSWPEGEIAIPMNLQANVADSHEPSCDFFVCPPHSKSMRGIFARVERVAKPMTWESPSSHNGISLCHSSSGWPRESYMSDQIPLRRGSTLEEQTHQHPSSEIQRCQGDFSMSLEGHESNTFPPPSHKRDAARTILQNPNDDNKGRERPTEAGVSSPGESFSCTGNDNAHHHPHDLSHSDASTENPARAVRRSGSHNDEQALHTNHVQKRFIGSVSSSLEPSVSTGTSFHARSTAPVHESQIEFLLPLDAGDRKSASNYPRGHLSQFNNSTSDIDRGSLASYTSDRRVSCISGDTANRGLSRRVDARPSGRQPNYGHQDLAAVSQTSSKYKSQPTPPPMWSGTPSHAPVLDRLNGDINGSSSHPHPSTFNRLNSSLPERYVPPDSESRLRDWGCSIGYSGAPTETAFAPHVPLAGTPRRFFSQHSLTLKVKKAWMKPIPHTDGKVLVAFTGQLFCVSAVNLVCTRHELGC